MVSSLKTGMFGMSIDVSVEQYLLAWAVHTAHVYHAHQTYATFQGPKSYVEYHLIPVADSAYSQGESDRKLARYLQSQDKSLSVAMIKALMGTVGLLHDLREDTEISSLEALKETLIAFKNADHAQLVAEAQEGDNRVVRYKDNNFYALPHDFTEKDHLAMQSSLLKYLGIIDKALWLLSKDKGMSYEEYRHKLIAFEAKSVEDNIAWVLALCVKAHDSQNNYMNCMKNGNYKWSLKYVDNLGPISARLSGIIDRP